MNIQSKLGGFFASLELACDIATGSLRLLRLYPVLIVPLFPVFLMVLGVEFGLLFIWNLFQALVLIFVVACVLMFSFIISPREGTINRTHAHLHADIGGEFPDLIRWMFHFEINI